MLMGGAMFASMLTGAAKDSSFIDSSWKKHLAALSPKARAFITRTESGTTTDRKTLSCGFRGNQTGAELKTCLLSRGPFLRSTDNEFIGKQLLDHLRERIEAIA
jgi:hypothetical protein